MVRTIVKSTSFDLLSQAFPITYQDNLKYHLYGGTILATLGNYKLAAEFLEAVSDAQPVEDVR